MTDRIAAIFGPSDSLPTSIQFLRLWRALHNRKNFLFAGHPEAGWLSAVIYSILGSCHRHKINPALYLRDVLSRLPNMQQSEVPTITPKAWAKAHPEGAFHGLRSCSFARKLTANLLMHRARQR